MVSSNWFSLNTDVNKSVCSLWCGGVMFYCGICSEVGSTGLAVHPITSLTVASQAATVMEGGCPGIALFW